MRLTAKLAKRKPGLLDVIAKHGTAAMEFGVEEIAAVGSLLYALATIALIFVELRFTFLLAATITRNSDYLILIPFAAMHRVGNKTRIVLVQTDVDTQSCGPSECYPNFISDDFFRVG